MIANSSETATKPNTRRKLSSDKPKTQPKSHKDKTSQSSSTKSGQLIEMLKSNVGASIEEMMTATGWQQHSVRGFLAGTVKRKLGLNLMSSVHGDEPRRYRIVARRGR